MSQVLASIPLVRGYMSEAGQISGIGSALMTL